jgi:hypothetical protein
LLFDCSLADVKSYFQRRLTYYAKDNSNSPELCTLIAEITTEFELQEEKQPKPTSLVINKSSFFFQNEVQNNPLEEKLHDNTDETIFEDNYPTSK